MGFKTILLLLILLISSASFAALPPGYSISRIYPNGLSGQPAMSALTDANGAVLSYVTPQSGGIYDVQGPALTELTSGPGATPPTVDASGVNFTRTIPLDVATGDAAGDAAQIAVTDSMEIPWAEVGVGAGEWLSGIGELSAGAYVLSQLANYLITPAPSGAGYYWQVPGPPSYTVKCAGYYADNGVVEPLSTCLTDNFNPFLTSHPGSTNPQAVCASSFCTLEAQCPASICGSNTVAGLGSAIVISSTSIPVPASQSQLAAAMSGGPDTWGGATVAPTQQTELDALSRMGSQGASIPLTGNEPASYTASPWTSSVKTLSSSTVTNPDGSTTTVITSAQNTVTPQTVGNTVATSGIDFNVGTTTTTTTDAPSGDTSTQTTTSTNTPSPVVNNSSSTTTTNTQAQPTVSGQCGAPGQPVCQVDVDNSINVNFPCGGPNQSPCSFDVPGTFVPPTEALPTIPTAPTFQQSTQTFMNTVASAPLIAGVSSIVIPDGEACPTFSLPVPFFNQTYTIDAQCTVMASAEPVLHPICLFIFGLIAVRYFMSA